MLRENPLEFLPSSRGSRTTESPGGGNGVSLTSEGRSPPEPTVTAMVSVSTGILSRDGETGA